MLIGSGLMANAFNKYAIRKDILIFASGVSSSKNCTLYDCDREEHLLRDALRDNVDNRLFVYFSSCSITNPNLTNDPYHVHKKNMEKIIQKHASRCSIFRLPNVVGSVVNPNTLFYYLANSIKTGKMFKLWSGAKRNIIDIDDVVKIVNYSIDNNMFVNETVNVANLNSVTVDELVSEIERYLGLDAVYSKIECNENFYIDTIKIKPIVDKLGLEFDNGYLGRTVDKYCLNLELAK